MALYFSIRDLKAIRNSYSEMGITNSAVLDQIKVAISVSHFNSEDIAEISDIISEYDRMVQGAGVIISMELTAAREKTILIQQIQEKSKFNKANLRVLRKVG